MSEIHLAVDGVVLKGDKVVLVYRKYEPEGWALPGGHVEVDETLKKACVREVKEETGLEVEIVEEDDLNPLGVYDDPDRDPRKRMVSVVYVCKAKDGELRASSDAKRVKAFHVEEAMDLELQFDHFKILRDFLERHDR
ncbi:MAG: NUDIX domain-containing protein [Candidatus Aenigmatarchaeota archaeon]